MVAAPNTFKRKKLRKKSTTSSKKKKAKSSEEEKGEVQQQQDQQDPILKNLIIHPGSFGDDDDLWIKHRPVKEILAKMEKEGLKKKPVLMPNKKPESEKGKRKRKLIKKSD